MPKSKSKRNRYVPPPKPRPKPAPVWVPVLFFTLAGLGLISILARYILATPYPIFDNNWWQWGGLIAIAAAFGVATQWR